MVGQLMDEYACHISGAIVQLISSFHTTVLFTRYVERNILHQ